MSLNMDSNPFDSIEDNDNGLFQNDKPLEFRPRIKQTPISLDPRKIDPVTKKIVDKMNRQGFMLDEPDIYIRLEMFKRKVLNNNQ